MHGQLVVCLENAARLASVVRRVNTRRIRPLAFTRIVSLPDGRIGIKWRTWYEAKTVGGSCRVEKVSAIRDGFEKRATVS